MSEAKILISVDTAKGKAAVVDLDKATDASKATFEATNKVLINLDGSIQALDKTVQELNRQFKQVKTDTVRKEVVKLTVENEKLVDSAQRVGVEMTKIPSSSGQAATGLTSFTRTSNMSSLALLDFTRIVEDSAFGIRGMANNINPAIMSFGRLKAETGSTTAAFKAMGASMLGPGGIAFAIGAISSLLIAFGPQIADLFDEGTSDAEKFRDRLQEINDLIADMRAGMPEVGFDKDSDAVRARIDQLLGDLALLQNTRREMVASGRHVLTQTTTGGTGAAPVTVTTKSPALVDIERQIAVQKEYLRGQAERLALVLEEEAANERLSITKREERDAESKAKREQEEATRRAKQTAEQRLKDLVLLNAIRPDATPFTVFQSTQRDRALQQEQRKLFATPDTRSIDRMPVAAKETESAMDALFSKLVQIQQLSAAGIIDPQQRAEAEIQAIRQGLEEMVAAGIDPSSEAFQTFINQLDEAEVKAVSMAERFRESFGQIAQVAQQATQVLGALFGSMHQSRMNEIERERRASVEAIDAQLKNERLSDRERTKLLEKRNAAEEAIREKTRKAQQEHAERQKLISLFEIAVNTASAVVEALPNIPLSIVVGALGAIQAGIVAATPVPEFARGVSSFRGGTALVGERGPELVNLPAGSNVITNENTERLLAAMDRGAVPGASFSDSRMVHAIHRVEAAIDQQTERLERVERFISVQQLHPEQERYGTKLDRIGRTA